MYRLCSNKQLRIVSGAACLPPVQPTTGTSLLCFIVLTNGSWNLLLDAQPSLLPHAVYVCMFNVLQQQSNTARLHAQKPPAHQRHRFSEDQLSSMLQKTWLLRPDTERVKVGHPLFRLQVVPNYIGLNHTVIRVMSCL